MADMTVDDIASLYLSGATLQATGEACGLGPAKVRDVLTAHGVTIRDRWKTRNPRLALRDERIERLWKLGKSKDHIADLFDISTSRVRQVLQQRGCIDRRPHA